jgi:hypothetical protein
MAATMMETTAMAATMMETTAMAADSDGGDDDGDDSDGGDDDGDDSDGGDDDGDGSGDDDDDSDNGDDGDDDSGDTDDDDRDDDTDGDDDADDRTGNETNGNDSLDSGRGDDRNVSTATDTNDSSIDAPSDGDDNVEPVDNTSAARPVETIVEPDRGTLISAVRNALFDLRVPWVVWLAAIVYAGVDSFYRAQRRYHNIDQIPAHTDINDRQPGIPWVAYLPAAAFLTTSPGQQLRRWLRSILTSIRNRVRKYVRNDTSTPLGGLSSGRPHSRTQQGYPDTVSTQIRSITAVLAIVTVGFAIPLTLGAVTVVMIFGGLTGPLGVLIVAIVVMVGHVAFGYRLEFGPL